MIIHQDQLIVFYIHPSICAMKPFELLMFVEHLESKYFVVGLTWTKMTVLFGEISYHLPRQGTFCLCLRLPNELCVCSCVCCSFKSTACANTDRE